MPLICWGLCTGRNGYVDYLVFVKFLLEKTLRRGVEAVLEKHAGRFLLHVLFREQPVPHHRRRLRHRQRQSGRSLPDESATDWAGRGSVGHLGGTSLLAKGLDHLRAVRRFFLAGPGDLRHAGGCSSFSAQKERNNLSKARV